jgi:hypothetical protein
LKKERIDRLLMWGLVAVAIGCGAALLVLQVVK